MDAGGQQQGFCCEGNSSSTFEIRGRRPTRVGSSSSRRLLEGGFVRGRRKCKMGQDERGMGCSKMMARKRRLLLMIFSGCVTVHYVRQLLLLLRRLLLRRRQGFHAESSFLQ